MASDGASSGILELPGLAASEERERGLARAGRLAALLALLAGLGILYWVLEPAMIDGDSVGYLKDVGEPELLPGHVATLPLFRLVARVVPARSLIELYWPLRLLSILAALGTLGLFHDAARRFYPFARALAATALLGVCWGFWRSAQEVESYAMAVLMATSALWALLRYRLSGRLAWAVVAGAAAGLAALFHLTLVLLGVPVAALLWRWSNGPRRWKPALLALSVLSATVAVALALALHVQGLHRPVAAWRWLHSADHGLPYVMVWPRTFYELLAGLGKTLVWAPYTYDAPVRLAVLLGVVGWLIWGVLLFWSRRAPRSPRTLDARALLLAWCGPLALFGVSFFPADTERWIFLLPVVALLLARIAPRRLVAAIVLLALLNGTALLLRTLDRTPREHAAEADRLLDEGDLVVHPGHGWDELIGLTDPYRVYKFPLVYFVGAAGGLGRAERLLGDTMREVWDRGDRVFVARLHDRDERGWGMLEGQGLSREGFEQLFRRYHPQPTALPDLWLLTPPRR